ncbi:hypothetical protein T439DRAFT_321042 [Meredithblackwellia eburnea MCA 4105]
MPDLMMLSNKVAQITSEQRSTDSSEHKQHGTILVYQQLNSPELLAKLDSLFARVIYYPVDGFHLSPTAPTPSASELAEADVLFAVQLPRNLTSITQTPRLKLLQGLSSGVGHILAGEFWKSIPADHGLVFANSTGLQVAPIGEHVVASILMLWHRLPTLIIKAHETEEWVSNAELGGHYVREMRGATIGILGYGAIGREVARLCSAFGTTIIACTRTGVPSPLSVSAYQVPGTGDASSSIPLRHFATTDRASFHSFLQQCDVVVNTLPGSPANEGLIGEDELKAMKGDALLINIGRGTTVCTEPLIEALMARRSKDELVSSSGTLRIGGASLDVTNPEPLPAHHPLFKMDNCIITPHSSGLSTAYLGRGVALLSENVCRLRSGKKLLNVLRE